MRIKHVSTYLKHQGIAIIPQIGIIRLCCAAHISIMRTIRWRDDENETESLRDDNHVYITLVSGHAHFFLRDLHTPGRAAVQ
jgi:hypothetical protein